MSAWSVKTFSELTLDELYALLRLRSEVFVVEQNCAYQDIDDEDRKENVLHLIDYYNGEMKRYARLIDRGSFVAMGRVVCSPSVRGKGQGYDLLNRAIKEAETRWPGCEIRLAAQTYAQKFYAAQGFAVSGSKFLEDGIEHVPMSRVTRDE